MSIYSGPTDEIGEKLFLHIACEDDEIIYSEVLSNFTFVETILEEK